MMRHGFAIALLRSGIFLLPATPWLLPASQPLSCEIRLANGDRFQAELLSLDAEGILCQPALSPGTQVAIDRSRTRQIRFSDEANDSPAPFSLTLRDFSELRGEWIELNAEELLFDAQDLGPLQIPRSWLHRLERTDTLTHHGSALQTSPREHALFLTRGIQLSGEVERADRQTLQLKSESLAAQVQLSAVQLWEFPDAETSPRPFPAQRAAGSSYLALDLRNGTHLVGQNPELQGRAIHLTLVNQERLAVPVEQLLGLSFSAGNLFDSRQILVWDAYADRDGESRHTVEALREGLPDWEIQVYHQRLFDDEFRRQLLKSRALVIPEPEHFSNHSLEESVDGERFLREVLHEDLEPALKEFLRYGGNLVFCGLQQKHLGLLEQLDLLATTISRSRDNSEVAFSPRGHQIGEGIGETFRTTNSTQFYQPGPKVESWTTERPSPIVAQSFDGGWVILLGMDYFQQSDATNRILCNAVRHTAL
ncbi:MAG: hypothetical protein AAF555_07385 [Verrucomicrobiota bacterium]